MTIWRNLVLCLTLTGIVLTGAFLGCTRQIDVMPTLVTPVATKTPTGTSTPTVTLTPNGPTNTFTATGTPTNTYTPAPPTNTFTITNTPTATGTPTQTNTPTPNYLLIDDFSGTAPDYQGGDNSEINVIQDQAGNWRDGFWFSNSSATSVVSYTSTTAPPGFTTAAEMSGTLSAYSDYAQLGFSFTGGTQSTGQGETTYDVTGGAGFTGISFWGKMTGSSTIPCTGSVPVIVNLSDTLPHSQAVPFTTTWQHFTVYWDQFSGLNTAAVSQLFFQIDGNGSSANYDMVIGDLTFVTGADPFPPTPVPTSMIVNFENGNSNLYTGNTSNPLNGIMYTYDNSGTNSQPPIVCPGEGGTFFPSAGGYQSFWNGSLTTTVPASDQVAIGLNFLAPQGPYDASPNHTSTYYNGIQFYMKWSETGGTSGVRVNIPIVETEPPSNNGNCTGGSGPCYDDFGITVSTGNGGGWTLYQMPFSTITQAYAPWGTFDPSMLLAIHWIAQDAGATYTISVDNVSFY